MPFRFLCPACGTALRVPDKLAGKAATCPNCKTPLVVPTPVGAATRRTARPGARRPLANGASAASTRTAARANAGVGFRPFGRAWPAGRASWGWKPRKTFASVSLGDRWRSDAGGCRRGGHRGRHWFPD